MRTEVGWPSVMHRGSDLSFQGIIRPSMVGAGSGSTEPFVIRRTIVVLRHRHCSRGSITSAVVQVFGCRHAETIPTLGQPASEKRQGTKSRGVGHRQCSGCYGDLASA